MRTVLPYGGLTTDDYTKIVLDLEDSSTMLVILPQEGVSIDDLLKTPAQVESLFAVDEEYPLYLDLRLPKFSFGTELKPVKALESMGITLAFGGGDFSGMLENAGSFSTIQHGTHFSIDEHGVQAAAYTVAPMTGGGSTEEPLEITVNRPFLFAVVAENEIPLFAGVVNDPTLV